MQLHAHRGKSDLAVYMGSYMLIENVRLACVYRQLQAHREMSDLPVYMGSYRLIGTC